MNEQGQCRSVFLMKKKMINRKKGLGGGGFRRAPKQKTVTGK